MRGKHETNLKKERSKTMEANNKQSQTITELTQKIHKLAEENQTILRELAASINQMIERTREKYQKKLNKNKEL